MRVGVQFTGTLASNQTQRWFTFNWPLTPTSPRSGGLQVDWQVEVERASANFITYWITIKNLTSLPVNIEARYAMLN